MARGEAILNIVERVERQSDRLEAEQVARLHRAMDASFAQLTRELRTAYPELQSIGGLLAAQQKLLVLDRLGSSLQLLKPDQAADYERQFRELLTTGSNLGGTLADELMAAYDEPAFDGMLGIPVEALANQASEGVRRLYRYSEEFQERANIIIGQGLIQGWGARKVANLLRREAGLTKGKAETIARTEMMSALNNGSLTRYEQMDIDLVLWTITPSEGLCGRCAVRNQRVYRRDAVFYPVHPRCRCFLSPIRREWLENGVFDVEFAKSYREEGLEQLKQNGLKPDYSPSGFERKAGLETAPTPVWEP